MPRKPSEVGDEQQAGIHGDRRPSVPEVGEVHLRVFSLLRRLKFAPTSKLRMKSDDSTTRSKLKRPP